MEDTNAPVYEAVQAGANSSGPIYTADDGAPVDNSSALYEEFDSNGAGGEGVYATLTDETNTISGEVVYSTVGYFPCVWFCRPQRRH